jgi:lipooligosaccharide transport system permease protein
MESRTTTLPEPSPRVPAWLRWPSVSPRSAARLWQRNWARFSRFGVISSLPNFFEPLLYLLSIGVGLGLYVGSRIMGVDYGLFIAPGLIAAATMNAAVWETTLEMFTKLHFGRLYDAVVTTPLEPEDIALGELLWAVTRGAVAGLTFLLVAALFGYVASPWALAAPAAIVLIAVTFGLIGLIVTSVLPSIDLYSYFFSLFIMPMFLFSGIFFPVADLPDAARPIAWLTPLHHGVELLRALVLTGDVDTAAGHALWLAVLTLVLIPPALNLLRRRLVS